MKVAVSYLSSNDYIKCIKKINDSNADYVHADLCDGKYVENKNFTMGLLPKIFGAAQKKLHVHLMCQDPLKYVDTIASYDVSTIIFHLDATKDANKVIDYISSMGIRVGIALNPKDSIDTLDPYLKRIDEVLFLTVTPGAGGQPFQEEVLDKVDKFNEVKKDYNIETIIDGGVNADTISLLVDKDIDIVVSGSFVTNSDDYNERIEELKKGSLI